MSISSRTSGEKIQIGRVTSAHGLQGDVTVVPLTDFPERFRSMGSVSLYREGRLFRTLEVRGVRFGRGSLTLSTDLGSREVAEACVGADILIDAEERVELPEGRYWVDDLVGLRVEDAGGRPLGVVTDFLTGANELYEVQDPEGKRHYIPAVSAFIREINIEEGVLRVSLIEGLWD